MARMEYNTALSVCAVNKTARRLLVIQNVLAWISLSKRLRFLWRHIGNPCLTSHWGPADPAHWLGVEMDDLTTKREAGKKKLVWPLVAECRIGGKRLKPKTCANHQCNLSHQNAFVHCRINRWLPKKTAKIIANQFYRTQSRRHGLVPHFTSQLSSSSVSRCGLNEQNHNILASVSRRVCVSF